MAHLDRPVVAVVGGGFSGLMTALRLLEAPFGPRIRMIERRPWFARGAAYSTPDGDHLLNVRASNMSANPERPSEFLEWLAKEGDPQAASAFVSRGRYGAYLQAKLRRAAETAQAGRLILDADNVSGLSPSGEGWTLRMDVGRRLHADAVVLAVGNLAPHRLPALEDSAALSAAYVDDPWSDRLERTDAGLAVLLGTGLTMVDVALRLERERPRLKLLAVSRRGLLPRRHLDEGPASSAWSRPAQGSPVKLLRELRRRAKDEDWRAVLDGLRPQVQQVWGGWTLAERGRFLRHARPWWDVHRHRLSPAVASRLDHLTASGRLSTVPGRLRRISAAGARLEMRWTPRGTCDEVTVIADAVVNCTGPNGDVAASRDPLLSDLIAQGWIRPDPCGLGMEVDRRGRAVARDGRASSTLFAVGPMTRGALWEVTSVPDIRVQAAACANHVEEALRRA